MCASGTVLVCLKFYCNSNLYQVQPPVVKPPVV